MKDERLKALWVDGLKKARKCRWYMRVDDTFCPLGVLVDVISRTHPDKVQWIRVDDDWYAMFHYLGTSIRLITQPPPFFAGELGLNPTFMRRIQEVNDWTDRSLASIADLVERYA